MRVGRIPLSVALATALLGCRHSPLRVGLYDVPRSALPRVARAGFNLVTIAEGETNRAAYLREAGAAGIQVLAWPDLDSQSSREHTARLGRSPALWGWYLADEPDLHNVSPASLGREREALRAISGKPSLVVLASGTAVEKYRKSGSVRAVDWYPIPWAPLATVSREMRSARLASQGQPFWAVLQAFDWNAFPGLLDWNPPLRAPAPDELRCMTFLSLFQGASGILYYAYRAGDWDLPAHPELWSALASLVPEIRALSPIFRERVAWWPVQSRYDDPSKAYNAIHEGAIALGLFRAGQGMDSVRPGFYFVAINTTSEEVDFRFRLPFDAVEEIPMLRGSGSIEESEGWIAKRYQPYEVCIFGPINRPLLKSFAP